ncbi:hypothetical protein ABFY60_23390 [Lysinibacillus pakistanensis]|uniref:hypothetical protein n=1 Tax=Lysinibacillus pakistanensis TaxID=759811 RepID=UPI003D297B9F
MSKNNIFSTGDGKYSCFAAFPVFEKPTLTRKKVLPCNVFFFLPLGGGRTQQFQNQMAFGKIMNQVYHPEARQ